MPAWSETMTMPGAVDLHVHFRETGDNKSETIKSGSRAALLGGYAMVCDMPNNPGHETWSLERAQEKHEIIRRDSFIPIGIWAGSQPDSRCDNIGELAKMAPLSVGLKSYGAVTTGNETDYSPDDFREIWKEWHRVAPHKPIALHAGADNLEEFIWLAEELRHPLHVCHVNNPADVELVEKARIRDAKISCGVCPHHLFKTSHDELTQGAFAQMKPPLAEQYEAERLFEYLIDGSIDIIETDHAPHPYSKKREAEEDSGTCFGVPGIEFAIPLLLYQARKGRISYERIEEVTSTKPAEIIGVKISDGTIVEWELSEYRIEDEEDQVVSGAGWTPYLGMLAVGTVRNSAIKNRPLVTDWEIVSSLPEAVMDRREEL